VEHILLFDLCFPEEQVQPKEYSTKDNTEERVSLSVGTKEVPAENKLEEGTAEGTCKGEKGPLEGNPERIWNLKDSDNGV
jgi:hypothetical protein